LARGEEDPIVREIPHLRRFARALVWERERADDLVQDTLERALLKRHLWLRSGSLRSWLFRMLYRVFLSQRSRLSRRRAHDLVASPAIREGASLQTATQEPRRQLRETVRALEELPPAQRAAIVLVALEGVSYEEAAKVLDVPVGTVRSRLARARNTLRCVAHDGVPRQASLRTLRRVK